MPDCFKEPRNDGHHGADRLMKALRRRDEIAVPASISQSSYATVTAGDGRDDITHRVMDVNESEGVWKCLQRWLGMSNRLASWKLAIDRLSGLSGDEYSSFGHSNQ